MTEPTLTEDQYEAWRRDRDFHAWKHRMWDTHCLLPTQTREDRSRCFCGVEITNDSLDDHTSSPRTGALEHDDPPAPDRDPAGGYLARRLGRHALAGLMTWSHRFDDPIPLDDGRKLVTLLDAGNYISSLPEATQARPEWQTATEALLLVGNHGGDTLLPRIAMMRALNVGKPPPAVAPRCKAVKAYRVIR